ncbi:uncharacterized protein [Asterias amurensis]|uniref:uncharacterized protein n=1 Tax=Asterias amurensis TaxID=7602 RepID=UPI003AB5B5B3
MEVFILVLLFSLLTTKGAVAQDDLDWDGFGEADYSLYKLKPLSIIGFHTEQSSDYDSNLYPSSKGVDGNVDYGFFHTKNDEHSFWTVQLKEEHCIGKVTLFNRKDCCGARLANAVVRAGVSPFYNLNQRCGSPVESHFNNGDVIDVYCDPPLLASEVNVVLPNREYLHLHEVKVEEYPIQRCHQIERRISILNSPTEQSSGYDDTKYPAKRAADGFIGKFVSPGFSHTGHDFDPWWRVDLVDTHCISKVVLFNRWDCCSDRLSNAVVRAGTSKCIHTNTRCGSAITAEQAKIRGGVLAVYCGPPLSARYVSVNIPGRKEYLQLREVEIYELDVNQCESDERDLSIIGKPTEQSSYYDYRYSPDKAADGNLDTNLSPEFICTHTKEEDDPWWIVDLEDEHCISKVVLLNRGDCCSERLTNAVVRAGTSRNIQSNPQCGDVVSPAMATPRGGTIELVCDPPLVARYISVDIPSDKHSFLQLCEVTVKEFIGEDGCREPEPLVIKAPEPKEPVEDQEQKKVLGGEVKILEDVPDDMGP